MSNVETTLSTQGARPVHPSPATYTPSMLMVSLYSKTIMKTSIYDNLANVQHRNQYMQQSIERESE